MRTAATATALFLLRVAAFAQPLTLEKTIPLPGVQGRIDHLSIDLAAQRLFVAALGNDTVEVVDLKQGKAGHRITGLAEPQGVLYVPSANRLYVANGKDGSLRIYDGKSLQQVKSVAYGDDADNVRYDERTHHVYTGYGSGALGETDLDGTRTGDSKLDAHPESFQLERNGPRMFVNLPKSHKIAVVDRNMKSVIATWHTGGPQANYAMALDEPNRRLFVVCRDPASLVVLDIDTGRVVATLPTIGDCDDVFYDAKRKRIYAIGGEGAVAVVEQRDRDHYAETSRIPTSPGARTGFFSAELDRLFVAVRHPASIRAYAVP